eukprot:m.485609 g.485609  ORF g.485609 m.485609 type:complete len:409 (-) comp23889_c0_seq1:338-1564(-)
MAHRPQPARRPPARLAPLSNGPSPPRRRSSSTSPTKQVPPLYISKDWQSVYTDKGTPSVDALSCRCAACRALPKDMRGGAHQLQQHSQLPSQRLHESVPFKIGDRCILADDRTGVIRWIGKFDAAYETPDVFVGVQLDEAVGLHDGMYKGKRYFRCKAPHGVFVHKDDIALVKGRHELKYRGAECPATAKQQQLRKARTVARVQQNGGAAAMADEHLQQEQQYLAAMTRKLREAQERGEEMLRLEQMQREKRMMLGLDDSAKAAPSQANVPLERSVPTAYDEFGRTSREVYLASADEHLGGLSFEGFEQVLRSDVFGIELDEDTVLALLEETYAEEGVVGYDAFEVVARRVLADVNLSELGSPDVEWVKVTSEMDGAVFYSKATGEAHTALRTGTIYHDCDTNKQSTA